MSEPVTNVDAKPWTEDTLRRCASSGLRIEHKEFPREVLGCSSLKAVRRWFVTTDIYRQERDALRAEVERLRWLLRNLVGAIDDDSISYASFRELMDAARSAMHAGGGGC